MLALSGGIPIPWSRISIRRPIRSGVSREWSRISRSSQIESSGENLMALSQRLTSTWRRLKVSPMRHSSIMLRSSLITTSSTLASTPRALVMSCTSAQTSLRQKISLCNLISTPASKRLYSRIWLMTPSSASAAVRLQRRYPSASGFSSISRTMVVKAITALSGVRSSWDMLAMKLRCSLLVDSASACALRASTSAVANPMRRVKSLRFASTSSLAMSSTSSRWLMVRKVPCIITTVYTALENTSTIA
mmetsp:Transcript_12369/g.39209  ORF Transcript_12369/g.39209 Transcript_12369/m.39209 type:complete len:248 (-) Transcript_12369:1014-1757(-)